MFENHEKCLASLLILTVCLKKMGGTKSLSRRADCQSVLHLSWKACLRGIIENDPKNLEKIFKDFQKKLNMKITPHCELIYYPWIASSEKKAYSTMIGSERQRFWSTHISTFYSRI